MKGNDRCVYKHYRFPAHGTPACAENFAGRHGAGFHFRRGRDGDGNKHSPWTPLPKGGYTFCYIYDSEGNLVSMGLAECSPRDAFSYKLGREISKGRAMKNLRQIEEVLVAMAAR